MSWSTSGSSTGVERHGRGLSRFVSRWSASELTGGNGPFVAGTFFDLATVGYQQAEYALPARRGPTRAPTSGLTVVEEAPITTRVIVYRPADAAAFDGTVVVEWLNVSGGLDAAPVWLFTHRELVRSGSAWIGVSAQRLGVNGGEGALGMPTTPLVTMDAARYGGLDHPGDRFSYDLFSMAGELARTGTGTILEGLPVERVLGVGESQSAFRLTTYVNEVDPHDAGVRRVPRPRPWRVGGAFRRRRRPAPTPRGRRGAVPG